VTIIRIEKGIVGFNKSGSIIVFTEGNVGKDNEYLQFNKTPESKQLARLYCTPHYLYKQIVSADKDAEDLEKLIAWVNEHGYGEFDERTPKEIDAILNDKEEK
jgi:hypothetical protein